MQIETQLKQLILDDEFTNIQSLVNEEVNLMSILNVAHRELQHSNLLAWLFDTNETHGLNNYFIKEFIKLYFRENEYQDLGNSNSSLSVFDFVDMDFSDLEIKREHKNIDLLILSKKNSLCIIIENKIFARESIGQLKKYREYAQKTYKDYRHKIFIFLSLIEQEINEHEQEHYVSLSYEHIKKLIENILKRQEIGISKNTKFVLEQYLQTLNSLMNENQHIEKIAKEIYKKYKSAFDLVFKYTSPTQSNRIEHNLQELISEEPSILPFHSSKAYIRFQPKFLYKNIEKLKQKKFIDPNDDLTENWLFLCEFRVNYDSINFDIKIGEYSNSECREKLYNLYLQNTDFFTKVKKANGQLRPSWHQAYQRKVITPNEYSKFIESDEDKLFDKIEVKFKKIIDEDIFKLKEIIENELNN